ncbi:MAG: NB-ARC domain-containing protein [Trueperaceae bacterium]|nr:NB-ARC domain-containing protein [Trueperaceae bacterium]
MARILWPTTHRPRSNLSVALSDLRRELPGCIRSDEWRVWSTVATDAERMLAALDRREVERALALYGGGFLEPVPYRGPSAELEEWILETRERMAASLQAGLIAAAERLAAERQADDGSAAATVRLARRAVELPGALGMSPDLLQRAERLLGARASSAATIVRRELAELGAQPSTDAQEVAAAPTPPAPAWHRAPPIFVGREQDVDAIQAMLRHPDCRLLTLLGPGGIGKTQLAFAVGRAAEASASYGGRVRLVALGPLEPSASIERRILDAFGVEGGADEDAPARLASRLGRRDWLLILDEFETALDRAPLVADLLHACPRLTVLITSRRRLQLSREWVYPVHGLDSRRMSKANRAAAPSDAERLFVAYARRADARFEVTPADLSHVRRICDQVGGSPLALSLAASWAGALSCADISREIERGADLLRSRHRDATPRHRSMRSVFETSWRRLDPAMQTSFARLAVFPGTFDAPAACRVAGFEVSSLADLVDASMVVWMPRARGRYELHPLVRRFAAEKLTAGNGKRRHAAQAHARHYLALLPEGDRPARAALDGATVEALVEEFPNVRAAWTWWAAHGNVVRLVWRMAALGSFFEVRGWLDEGAALFSETAVLLEAREGRSAAVGNAEAQAAWLRCLAGHTQDAADLARSSLRALATTHDGGGLAVALETLGLALHRSGRFDEAAAFLQRGVELVRETDPVRHAYFASSLCIVAIGMGAYDRAANAIQMGLSLQRRLDDAALGMYNVHNLGRLHFALGDFATARLRLRQAVDIATEIGHQQQVPELLAALARAHAGSGEWSEAEVTAAEALREAEAAGTAPAHAATLALLARIAAHAHRHDEAEAHLQAAAEVCDRHGLLPVALDVLLASAQAEVARGAGAGAAAVLRLITEHPAAEAHVRRAARRSLRALGRSSGG